eukprot:TRINITY_DN10196_c0_g1_i1.p1 TRINITY_DN10196_c0_g1~~TRINITY_DN10196_c0_g1_i1.p1  ORF type:complete len:185 (+),score=28.10 TRINITY_DN10196_c0_g1_i1:328-882(+)
MAAQPSAAEPPSTPATAAEQRLRIAERNAEIEARAVAISKNVRCLECGHQSIEESGAEIAVLLRKAIRDELRHGRSEKEIYKRLSEEFGEGVLYAPNFDWQTASIYLVPVVPVLCFGGAAAMALYYRRRRLAPTVDARKLAEITFRGIPLTARERQVLNEIVQPPYGTWQRPTTHSSQSRASSR